MSLSITDIMAEGREVFAEEQESDFWSPQVSGEWLIGEVMSIEERSTPGRKPGDPSRPYRLYVVYGQRGHGGSRGMPKPADVFGPNAELIPFTDGRLGVKRCLSQPVTGADRRGAAVGDVVMLYCKGRSGKTYVYGRGYLAEPDQSNVPESAREELAKVSPYMRG